ncbi:hypothetical protein Tco_0681729 [Tanacetum coccineum]|uniref:Uncharacterized protein n=1 Tax=Tanacetum coccineum TaxID=301880 RepID=A0ABQ4XQS3_9ASTR
MVMMVTSGGDIAVDGVASWGEGGEAVEVRVVVRRVVAWRWRVGGGDGGDATVGMVAAGGVVDSHGGCRGVAVVVFVE